MNYGIVYYAGEDLVSYDAEHLAGLPFTDLIIDPATDLNGSAPDTDLTGLDTIRASTGGLLYGYLNFGKVSDGRYFQTEFAPEDIDPWLGGDPAGPNTFDIAYWRPEVVDILTEVAVDQAEQGFDGIFLDDTGLYYPDAAEIFAETGALYSADDHANAALTVLHGILDLVTDPRLIDQKVTVNFDYYMLNDARVGGDAVEDVISDFLREVDQVLVEDFRSHYENDRDNMVANLGEVLDSGTTVLVSDIFERGVGRNEVLNFFRDAAVQHFVPFATAADIDPDTGGFINVFAGFDRDVPVFNLATDQRDVMVAGEDLAPVASGGGGDYLYGYDENGVFDAGGGGDQVRAGGGKDTIDGGAGHDLLKGQGGADSILGGGGRDTILGGGGNDVIDAGKGRDQIEGGRGNDTMTASESGAGNAYVFGEDFGNDDIFGFRVRKDVLVFEAIDGEAGDVDSFFAALSQDGGDVVYDAGEPGLNTIRLHDVDMAALTAANVEFI